MVLWSLAAGPWGSGFSASALVYGARSMALWWAGLYPGAAVGSRGLQAASLLDGEALISGLHSICRKMSYYPIEDPLYTMSHFSLDALNIVLLWLLRV